jgi:hypothetical protein
MSPLIIMTLSSHFFHEKTKMLLLFQVSFLLSKKDEGRRTKLGLSLLLGKNTVLKISAIDFPPDRVDQCWDPCLSHPRGKGIH